MRKLPTSLLAGAVACLRRPARRRAILQRLFLRRQPHRRRNFKPVLPPARNSRPIPARLGAGLRRRISVSTHARQPGRHRLRVGRRARDAAAGYPATPPTEPQRADRNADRRSFSPRARPIRMPSMRSGAAPTTFSCNLQASQRGRRSTRRRCRPTSALAAAQTRAAGRASCKAAARNTSSSGTCPTSARRPREAASGRRPRSARSSRLLQRDVTARSTPPASTTIRVNSSRC